MAKGGRPRKEIDRTQFEKLCGLQCTKEDIAGWFEVSEDTIERFCKREYGECFAVVFGQKRRSGIISLRKAGFDLARKNPAVHIFYAKNYLGMRDTVENTNYVITDETRKAVEGLIDGINTGTGNKDTETDPV